MADDDPLVVPLLDDLNFAETVANVLTSLPFIALGIQAPRLCEL